MTEKTETPARGSAPEEVVLVPVYRGGAAFARFLDDLLGRVSPDRVLVVDDGSDDGSAETALARGANCVRFPENRGKGAALEAGLRWWAERGALRIATLDADGQHPASVLPELFARARETDAGVVVGARDLESAKMPRARRFSNRTTTAMLSALAGVPLFDSQCGCRCYSSRAATRGLFPESGRFAWESEVLVLAARAGERIERIPIPVVYAPRGESGSHISHVRDTLRFLKLWFRLWRRFGFARPPRRP